VKRFWHRYVTAVLATGAVVGCTAAPPDVPSSAPSGPSLAQVRPQQRENDRQYHLPSAFSYIVQSGRRSGMGETTVKASCPASEQVFGGGYDPGTNALGDGFIYASEFGSSHGAWLTKFRAFATNAPPLYSYAICGATTTSRMLTYVSNTEIFTTAGNYQVDAICPSGSTVISGGYEKPALTNDILIVGTFYGSSHDRWWTNVWLHHLIYSSYSVTTYAVCASDTADYQYVSITQNVYAPGGAAKANCPQDYPNVVGGGFKAPFSGSVDETASEFGTDDSSWEGATTISYSASLTAYAVCSDST